MYTVLIVEDTLAVREEIYDILLMEGYLVLQAGNGNSGFEMALKKQPDLIISDILMPGLDGFELFEKLQGNPKTRSIPLIFLSAKAEKEDVRIGMNLGAEDYLTKPINVTDLLNAIKNKIKKKVERDDKNTEKTASLYKILKNQENELENYSHLISHELKSSLRNISDLLSWSQEDNDDTTTELKDISKSFQILEEKIEEMDQLLAKLEEYNNITTAIFKDKLVNTNTVAQQIINDTHTTASLTIKIKNTLPTLYIDGNMIRKVFEILLENALEHLDKKECIIDIECKKTAKEYIFSIKDNGSGINPKYHKKNFKMFQANESNKATGMGLSIVKKIISHYLGEVSLKSIPGVGTVFYFSIPLTQVAAANQIH
jgi:two-component system sensor histidine kinase/response regulator